MRIIPCLINNQLLCSRDGCSGVRCGSEGQLLKLVGKKLTKLTNSGGDDLQGLIFLQIVAVQLLGILHIFAYPTTLPSCCNQRDQQF
jgi:hypothetical protein